MSRPYSQTTALFARMPIYAKEAPLEASIEHCPCLCDPDGRMPALYSVDSSVMCFSFHSRQSSPTLSVPQTRFRVRIATASLEIKSLAYAYKQHPVGLLTLAVIQTYLPDTCLQSGQSEARPRYQIIAAEGVVVHDFEPVIMNESMTVRERIMEPGQRVRESSVASSTT
ncbi:hypothetical protein KCU62_g81, partial [Aureobasidium sp. EXF-3399]